MTRYSLFHDGDIFMQRKPTSLKRCVICFMVIFLSVSVQAIAGNAEDEAIQAAKDWLVMIDANDYGKSWDEAAEFFKASISKTIWVDSIRGIRPSLGLLISRTLTSAVYATSLPGAPDGEYVVIRFSTRFANKKSSQKT